MTAEVVKVAPCWQRIAPAVLQKPCDTDSFVSVQQVVEQQPKPVSYEERFGGKSRNEIIGHATDTRTLSESGSQPGGGGSTLTCTQEDDDASVSHPDASDVEPGDWADGIPSLTGSSGSSGTKGSVPPSESGEVVDVADPVGRPFSKLRATKRNEIVDLSPDKAENLEKVVRELLAGGPMLMAQLGGRIGEIWRRELRLAGGLKHFLRARPRLFFVFEDATKEIVHLTDSVPFEIQPPSRAGGKVSVMLPSVALALSVEATGVRLAVDRLLAIKTCLAYLTADHKISEVESRVYRLRPWPGPAGQTEEEKEAALAEEERMLAAFHQFYTDVCLRHPGFSLVSTNPVADVPLIDYSLSTIGKPPLSLRPGAGPLDAPATPVDFTSFICGITSVPPEPHWAAAGVAGDFINSSASVLERRGLEHEPTSSLAEVPQVAATRLLAWQYLRCLSILRLSSESAVRRLEERAARRHAARRRPPA